MRGAGGTSGGVGTFFVGLGMVVVGAYLLLTRVTVGSGAWSLWGYNAFGLSLLPLLVGIGWLFYDGRSLGGRLLTAIGALIILAGIIGNLHIYFAPTPLFDTLVMLGSSRPPGRSKRMHRHMSKIFISYNRQSQASAKSLVGDVESLGHDVWFDQELSGGQAWWDQIRERVRGCDVFVFVLDPNSLNCTACKREFGYAGPAGPRRRAVQRRNGNQQRSSGEFSCHYSATLAMSLLTSSDAAARPRSNTRWCSRFFGSAG